MKYIISKIEHNGTDITYTNIGYVTSVTDADEINSIHCAPMVNWIETNKSDLESEIKNISEYFVTTPTCHQVEFVTENIDGLGLSLITDNINLTI